VGKRAAFMLPQTLPARLISDHIGKAEGKARYKKTHLLAFSIQKSETDQL
jgi:hypothetical protein